MGRLALAAPHQNHWSIPTRPAARTTDPYIITSQLGCPFLERDSIKNEKYY
jgi:hypothetical protein